MIVTGTDPTHTTVWLAGVRARVTYRLDDQEVARRRRAGGSGLDDIGLLDVLLGLPAGVPVPRPTHRPGAERAEPGTGRCDRGPRLSDGPPCSP